MPKPANSQPVVELAFSRAPRRPLCADYFKNGVFQRDKRHAMTLRHVQFDRPGYCSVILIDIDRRGAANAADDAGLPPPSWICMNPNNGHAHMAFVLSEPIRRTDSVVDRPVRFLRAVQAGLTTMLGGDRNYNGRLTKNPLSKDWVVEVTNKAYSLTELSEYIPDELLIYPNMGRQIKVGDLGGDSHSRNVTMFNILRQRFYKQWGLLVSMPTEDALKVILDAANEINATQFLNPLSSHELLTISRSINRFLRMHFRAASSSLAFLSRQAYRQELSAQRRRSNNEERISQAARAIAASGRTMTLSALAREAGLSRQTLSTTHSEHCVRLLSRSEMPNLDG